MSPLEQAQLVKPADGLPEAGRGTAPFIARSSYEAVAVSEENGGVPSWILREAPPRDPKVLIDREVGELL